MTFKNHILLITGFFLSPRLWSQDHTRLPGFSFQLNGGVAFARITDKTFSSLPYAKAGFCSGAEVARNSRKSIHRIVFFYTGSQMITTPVPTGSNMQLRYGIVNYQFLKPVTDKDHYKRARLYAGAIINAVWNNRTYSGYINNNKTSDIFLALQATAEMIVNVKRQSNEFQISNQLAFSAAGIVVQPVYGANTRVVPVTNPGSLKEITKSAVILTIPRFLQFRNITTLRYNITPVHTIAVHYTIDFFRTESSRNTAHLYQNAGIGYQYTLGKKQKK
jgi:hypothetical protein